MHLNNIYQSHTIPIIKINTTHHLNSIKGYHKIICIIILTSIHNNLIDMKTYLKMTNMVHNQHLLITGVCILNIIISIMKINLIRVWIKHLRIKRLLRPLGMWAWAKQVINYLFLHTMIQHLLPTLSQCSNHNKVYLSRKTLLTV